MLQHQAPTVHEHSQLCSGGKKQYSRTWISLPVSVDFWTAASSSWMSSLVRMYACSSYANDTTQHGVMTRAFGAMDKKGRMWRESGIFVSWILPGQAVLPALSVYPNGS